MTTREIQKCAAIGLTLGVVIVGIIFAVVFATSDQPKPIGQDVGGGIRTTCIGTDRLYISDGALAVIHDDRSCDAGG